MPFGGQPHLPSPPQPQPHPQTVAYDEGKLDHSLVPAEWSQWDVLPFQAGIDKGYARDNWKQSINTDSHDEIVRKRMNSCERHYLAMKAGEEFDPETGVAHAVLLSWNAKFVHTYNEAKRKKAGQ